MTKRSLAEAGLVQDRNVIEMFGTVCEIRCRIDSGERAEVVDEAGLVEVSAVQCDAGPIHLRFGSQMP